jgi:LmbE family N-acetylglucosaminyl deacetylase
LRRVVYPALEATWAAGFATAGRRRPRGRAHPWRAAGGQRVGIVAPHPDDETVGCGGVAALHAAAGDRVAVLIVTDGGASRASRPAGAGIVARRAAEARAAGAALGVIALRLGGLPEGGWSVGAGARVIGAWLAAERPALLYAPSCVDYHPEHLRVALALARALAALPADAQPRVRVYEVFTPLGSGLVNCVASIGPARAAKAEALACYASQAAGLIQVPRRDGYLGRYYARPGGAEAFWDMSALAYSAFIAAGDWSGRASPFRGLRGRPFSDPLAWVVGGRERRRLATAVPAAPRRGAG